MDGSGSEDPQDEEITFSWTSLDGFNDNISDPDSQYTTFEFPSTELDQIFSFILTVSDSENSIDDTVSVFYLDNDAPVAYVK